MNREIQKNILKLSGMKRYMLCEYDHSFINNNVVTVVLRTITDEPDYVGMNASCFEVRSSDGLYYGKSLYFKNFLQEDMCVSNFNFLNLNEQKDLIEEYLLNRLVVINPYYLFNDDWQLFYKNYAVVDVIDVEQANPYLSIPRIANEQEYANFLNNEPFSLVNYSQELMGIPRYVSFGYSIFSINHLTTISDNQFKVENTDHIIRCRVDYMACQNDDTIIDFYEEEIGFIYVSKYVVLNSEKQTVLTKYETEQMKAKQEKEKRESQKTKNVVEGLYAYIQQKGLCYTMEDVENFFVCMKTKQTTLLSGLGKTQLAICFAEYFNMREEGNTFLYISANSEFDVMGSYNAETKLYEDSKWKVASFLKHVQDHPETMHMILLDRFNEKENESWLNPLFEQLKEKKVELYSQTCECKNKEDFPNQLQWQDNLLVVGTFDTSSRTKMIAEPILDVSFVLELEQASFVTFQKQQLKESQPISTYTSDFKEVCDVENASCYIQTFNERQLEFFDAINNVSNRLVTYQNVKMISMYLRCAQQFMSEQQAFDMVFKQTVLKKLNGTIDCIGDCVGTNLNYEGESNGSLTQIFNQYADVSDFKKSRMEVKTKVLNLKKYGYAR